jgi:hypothetical protein
MIYAIIGFFAIGALLGLFLLSFVLRTKQTPKAITLMHGFFVALALILLIFYSFNEGPHFTESIVLFVMAALGGAFLFYRDITGKSIPKWLAVGHGLLAITGFAFLLYSAFWR